MKEEIFFGVVKNSNSIIAITNDGPKGPAREAKLGSYKVALKAGAQIIQIFDTWASTAKGADLEEYSIKPIKSYKESTISL